MDEKSPNQELLKDNESCSDDEEDADCHIDHNLSIEDSLLFNDETLRYDETESEKKGFPIKRVRFEVESSDKSSDDGETNLKRVKLDIKHNVDALVTHGVPKFRTSLKRRLESDNSDKENNAIASTSGTSRLENNNSSYEESCRPDSLESSSKMIKLLSSSSSDSYTDRSVGQSYEVKLREQENRPFLSPSIHSNRVYSFHGSYVSDSDEDTVTTPPPPAVAVVVEPDNQDEAPNREPPRRAKRKKQIINAVQKLMEFYFSRANISKSKFMREKMDANSYIELEIFLTFNKIKALTDEVLLIRNAVKNSTTLKLSLDERKVKTTLDITPKENELDCTIYVDQLSRNHTHEWVWSRFSQYGPVEYVSMKRHKDTLKSKGFAFIEFDTPESASNVLSAFGNCPLSTQYRNIIPYSVPPNKDLRDSLRTFAAPSPTSQRTPPGDRSDNEDDLSRRAALPDSSSQDQEDQSLHLQIVRADSDNEASVYVIPDQVNNNEIPQIDNSEAECINEDRNIDGNYIDYPVADNYQENIPVQDPIPEENVAPVVEPRLELENALPNPVALSNKQKKKRKKKTLHRRLRLKNKEKKSLAEEKAKAKFEPEHIRLVVMSKRDWKTHRDHYVMEQKTTLTRCKKILKDEREEKLRAEASGDIDKLNQTKQKPVKEMGTVVKITLENPLVEKRAMVDGIRQSREFDILFIDATVGERYIYVRFRSKITAQFFLTHSVWKDLSTLLVWDEEDKYWEKIYADWEGTVMGPNKKKSKRGKQVVVARWKKRQDANDKQVLAAAHSRSRIERSTE